MKKIVVYQFEKYDVGQALYIALTDDTAEERWHGGADVFTPLPEQPLEV